jgi:hypothetical protein
MAFGALLFGVVGEHGLRLHFRGRGFFAGHLDDYLYPAFISHAGGKQLSNRSREDIFAAGLQSGRLRRARRHQPRALLTLGTGQERPRWLGNRLFVSLPVLEAIPYMRNGQLVARPEPPKLYALAIDPDTVGRAEVLDHDLAALRRHTAVMPRHAERIQACITCGVPTDNHHGAVQQDVWTFIQGHKACRHGLRSLPEAIGAATVQFACQQAESGL